MDLKDGYEYGHISHPKHRLTKRLLQTGLQLHLSDVNDLVDPHTWHDVQNAILYVKELRDAFCIEDSKHKETYQKNAAELIKTLENLDGWIKKEFKSIPAQKRIVVTTHDAFWYFSRAYDIQFLSPVGISTEAEASAQNVAKLINFINEHDIKAVFIENLANSKLIEQIANETKRSLQGTLYADSLSAPDGPAPDFVLLEEKGINGLTPEALTMLFLKRLSFMEQV
eukprot:gene16433-16612_t